MVLTNVIVFAVLKILHNFVSKLKSLFARTAEIRKITENAQCDVTFIFTNLVETANSFVKIRAVLE